MESYQGLGSNFLRSSVFRSTVVDIASDEFLGQTKDIWLNVYKLPDQTELSSISQPVLDGQETVKDVDPTFRRLVNALRSLHPIQPKSEDDNQSLPGNLHEYLNGIFDLRGIHLKRVNKFKKRLKDSNCLSHLSPKHINIIFHALDVTYVAFHNSNTKRQLGILLDRVAGVGMVLGENNEDVDVILGGMLYGVVD
ncbi:hypothetical protein EON65_55635, partial [archaeon]